MSDKSREDGEGRGKVREFNRLRDSDKEYDEPAVTLYSRSGEILQDGVFMLFKLQEITPEMMDAMTTPAVVTVYQSDTLPAAYARTSRSSRVTP